MSIARVCRKLVFLFVSVACLEAPLRAEESGPNPARSLQLAPDDWPCKTAFRADVGGELRWPYPALLEQGHGWRDNAAIQALVESAVTSSRTELGVSAIDEFAKGLSGNPNERDRILTTVFLGLRDEMSLYREMAAFGVMQGVANAELATGIAMDAKARGEDGRRTFRAALRIEDDAMDDARFLCHRLDALENKFQVLAETLMRHLTRSSG